MKVEGLEWLESQGVKVLDAGLGPLPQEGEKSRMTIDKDFLTKSLEGLMAQRDQQLVTLGKVEGALDIVSALLKRLDTLEPPSTKLDA